MSTVDSRQREEKNTFTLFHSFGERERDHIIKLQNSIAQFSYISVAAEHFVYSYRICFVVFVTMHIIIRLNTHREIDICSTCSRVDVAFFFEDVYEKNVLVKKKRMNVIWHLMMCLTHSGVVAVIFRVGKSRFRQAVMCGPLLCTF